MSLNESIIEEVALEWLAELGYAIGHGSHITTIAISFADTTAQFCLVHLDVLHP